MPSQERQKRRDQAHDADHREGRAQTEGVRHCPMTTGGRTKAPKPMTFTRCHGSVRRAGGTIRPTNASAIGPTTDMPSPIIPNPT
jgi:hypothetical protein